MPRPRLPAFADAPEGAPAAPASTAELPPEPAVNSVLPPQRICRKASPTKTIPVASKRGVFVMAFSVAHGVARADKTEWRSPVENYCFGAFITHPSAAAKDVPKSA